MSIDGQGSTQSNGARQVFHSTSRILGCIVIALSLIALAGWLLHSSAMIRIIPISQPMALSTACVFLCLGMASAVRRERRIVPLLLRVIGLAISTAAALSYVGVLPLPEPLYDALDTADFPLRMSVLSTISFCLLSVVGVANAAFMGRAVAVRQTLLVVLGFFILLSGIGFLYSFIPLQSFGFEKRTSAVSIFNFCLLFLAEVFRQPREGLLVPVLDPSPSGKSIRRILVFVFIIPITIGGGVALGTKAGLVDPMQAILLTVISTLLLLSIVVIGQSRLINSSEVELWKTQEEIRATLYCIGDGVIATDVRGNITRMNPVAASLTGWSEAEALGESLGGVFRVLDARSRASMGDPVPLVMGGQADRLASHALLIARDGAERPIADSAAPIRNKSGEITGVVCVFRDRTAEQTAQTALQESEARLRRVIEATNVGTWDWNVHTGEIEVNERWANILGYARAELPRLDTPTWLSWTHPDDSRTVGIQLREVLRRERPLFDFECRMKHRNGGWIWTHDRGKVIEWSMDGEPLRMAGTRSDVTERRTLESQFRQAQKMESVGRLAGGIAHDFNNMLGVILGYADLAMAHVDPAGPVHENLVEIRKAAERSAELTRQLLSFARKQPVNPRQLNLNEAVSGMLMMLRRLISEDIELVWKPGPGLWPVRIDPIQVHQVLANLAVNARDAIQGSGTLSIETGNVVLDDAYCATHMELTPGGYVLLSVSDTGSGMDKGTLEHLFEPFFTTKEVGKGTGLGLATVYGAVKQNGGVINVYSESGKGTTFKIYLPKTDAVAQTVSAAPTLPRRGDETVLLAEDEEKILTLGKLILVKYGYTVLSAQTPAEALELAQRHDGPIDLLITDVVMPGMNGKELRDKLKVLRPEVKTLFMSGYTADVITHHGVLDDGVEFLQKPFSMKTLGEKVHEVLHPVGGDASR